MGPEKHLTQVALFPQQLQPLEDRPADGKDDMTFLRGPPGTGRTVCLVGRGTQWLRDSSDTVFVVRTGWDGLPSAYLVQHQLVNTAAQGAEHRVRLLDYCMDKRTAVREMSDYATRNKVIYILADDADM